MKTRLPLFALLTLLALLVAAPASAQEGGERNIAPLGPQPELINGDFGVGSYGWFQQTTGTSPNGIICNATLCGDNIFYKTYTNSPTDFAVRFGGALAPQIDFLSQAVVFPRQGQATLSFSYWPTFVNPSANGVLLVLVDGIIVDSTSINTTLPEYNTISVDMTPYLNGKVRNLSFRFDKGQGLIFLNLDQIGFYIGSSYNWVNFEGAESPWNVKRSTNDRMVCNTPTTILSYNGPCAFEFRGSANERSQFRSVVNVYPPPLVEMPHPSLLRFTSFAGMFIKTKGAAPDATITLTITLTDGRVFTKSRLVPITYGQYIWVQTPLIKLPPDFNLISSYTVRVDNRSTSGRFWVDGVRVTINSVWE